MDTIEFIKEQMEEGFGYKEIIEAVSDGAFLGLNRISQKDAESIYWICKERMRISSYNKLNATDIFEKLRTNIESNGLLEISEFCEKYKDEYNLTEEDINNIKHESDQMVQGS